MSRISPCLLILTLGTPAFAEPAASDLKLVVASYVAAQEAVMEQGAGAPEVEQLIAFYAPDYVYHHPQFGAKVTGLDVVRRGVSSHLGETRDAEIAIKGILRNGDTFSVATETRFTVAADGAKVVRPGVMVLTFKGGRIVQRVDI